MTYSDLLDANWSGLPGDIIDSIVPYLPVRDVLKLCLYNDTFNRRVCQSQDSIVWKLLYQRDISNNVPSDHIASHYLDTMDHILHLDPQGRLFYGAEHGYDEIVNSALKDGADIHAWYDYVLRLAAENGYTDTAKLLLDRGADIHGLDDTALRNAAENALGPGAKTHTETVKALLDSGANISWLPARGHALNESALFWAADYGHTETVKLLLAHSATITPEIRRMVKRKGNPEIIALLK